MKYGNIVSISIKGKLFKLLVLFFQCVFPTEKDKSFYVNPPSGTRMGFSLQGKFSLGLNPLVFVKLLRLRTCPGWRRLPAHALIEGDGFSSRVV